MRLIGHLAEESLARVFRDYLYVKGIQNQIENEKEGWAIWIGDEDKVEQATNLLTTFQCNPTDPKYQAEAEAAARLREEAEQDQERYRKKLRNRRHLFRPISSYGFGPLTFVLIAIGVAVFILSKLGADRDRMMAFFITNYTGQTVDHSLPEVRHGEIWRLITPIFLHFSLLHILFNMLWLRDLGSMIEGRQTSWHLAILVLVIGVLSNLGQFYFGSGHGFGGMSGVVYGLLGYVWLRGKFDPGSGLYLHSSTVTMMIVWFIACYTGIFGPIANTAHAVGLGMGLAWGYLSSLRR